MPCNLQAAYSTEMSVVSPCIKLDAMTVQRDVMFPLIRPPVVHCSVLWEMLVAYATRNRPTAPYLLTSTHLGSLRVPWPAAEQKEDLIERWLMVRPVSRLLALVVRIKFWGAGRRIRFKSWYILDGQPGRRSSSCSLFFQKITLVCHFVCFVSSALCCVEGSLRTCSWGYTSTPFDKLKERIRLVVSFLELVNWLSGMANSPPVVPEFSQGTNSDRDVKLKSRLCSAKPYGVPVLLLLIFLLPFCIKAVASLEVSVWWHLSSVCWGSVNPPNKGPFNQNTVERTICVLWRLVANLPVRKCILHVI